MHLSSEGEEKKIFYDQYFLFVLSIKWLMPQACPLTHAVLIVHCLYLLLGATSVRGHLDLAQT